MSERVCLARQTARRFEDGVDGGWLEDRELGAREAEPVREVGSGLVARDAPHVGAHDDALDHDEACGPKTREPLEDPLANFVGWMLYALRTKA